jgi:DNA end-binding protein Ku
MSNLKKSWTGTLKLGFVTQPVAVYSAADSKAKTVAFNQLHRECGSRVKSHTVCITCDEKTPLGTADIQRGFEYEKGQYVVISDAELKTCQVENTKVIDLKEFVPVSEVTPLHIAESAFIAPVQTEMAEAYVLIREALSGLPGGERMAGIGTLCISNKEKLVAVMASGAGLVMHTLRHASEVREIKNVPTLDKLPANFDAKTVMMMRTLIDSMESKTLDLDKYPNRYVENVHKLIRAKADGEMVETPAPVPVKTVSNLAAMLEASLAVKKLPATETL